MGPASEDSKAPLLEKFLWPFEVAHNAVNYLVFRIALPVVLPFALLIGLGYAADVVIEVVCLHRAKLKLEVTKLRLDLEEKGVDPDNVVDRYGNSLRKAIKKEMDHDKSRGVR